MDVRSSRGPGGPGGAVVGDVSEVRISGPDMVMVQLWGGSDGQNIWELWLWDVGTDQPRHSSQHTTLLEALEAAVRLVKAGS